jgi:hypothetical protein
MASPVAQPVLGLRENWQQFSLLVLINAFVGGMVGLERTVVPLIGAEEFRIASTTIVRSSSASASSRPSPISSPDISPMSTAASSCWFSAGWSGCRSRS